MATGATAYLGQGVLRPFVRDEKNDFANDSGIRLVAACVGQVLGTKIGEIPWRPAFGSRLHLLRHRPNNPALAQLAQVYVLEALQKWERRVRVVRTVVSKSADGRELKVEVSFNVVDRYGTVISANQLVGVDVAG